MFREKLELSLEERKLVENKIYALILDIKDKVEKSKILSKNNKEFLENAVNTTSKILAPETKRLLNSIHYLLRKKTIETDFFKETNNQYEFNKRNILADLNSKFDFTSPKEIDFKEQNKLLASGSILLAGGGLSLSMSSVVPISIAVVISAGAYFLLNEINKKKAKTLLEEYLKNVEIALNQWVKDIENYYIQEVEKLKESLSKNDV